ncbi:hypothetical protein [Ferruginivarius sediminum]|uniref:Uncharacterized protein n=1 Tax=Ferruginivarius sediminum TaxID=2661937 RepID=A0A369TC55_9PROT|nr:hypothetical protein [Ferruginivarius sediminum]RDD60496.1 hypothetical protein DRB17_18020 [Ferruginivarius sediminum]
MTGAQQQQVGTSQQPSEELARTVMRQGELNLDAQLRLAMNADQRGASLASVFALLASGLLAAAAAKAVPPNGSIALAVSGALEVVAAVMCVVATWPRPFAVPGNRPKNWWDDGVTNRSLAECLYRESLNYESAISRNRCRLDWSSRWVTFGALVGVISPMVGLLTYLALAA